MIVIVLYTLHHTRNDTGRLDHARRRRHASDLPAVVHLRRRPPSGPWRVGGRPARAAVRPRVARLPAGRRARGLPRAVSRHRSAHRPGVSGGRRRRRRDDECRCRRRCGAGTRPREPAPQDGASTGVSSGTRTTPSRCSRTSARRSTRRRPTRAGSRRRWRERSRRHCTRSTQRCTSAERVATRSAPAEAAGAGRPPSGMVRAARVGLDSETGVASAADAAPDARNADPAALLERWFDTADAAVVAELESADRPPSNRPRPDQRPPPGPAARGTGPSRARTRERGGGPHHARRQARVAGAGRPALGGGLFGRGPRTGPRGRPAGRGGPGLHEAHRAGRRAGGAQARARHRARRAGRSAAAAAAADRRPRLRRHVPDGPRSRRRLLRLSRPWIGPPRPGARRHFRQRRFGRPPDGQCAGVPAEPGQATRRGTRRAGRPRSTRRSSSRPTRASSRRSSTRSTTRRRGPSATSTPGTTRRSSCAPARPWCLGCGPPAWPWASIRVPTTGRGERSLAAGDMLLAFTDGLTEALNEAGEEFGDAQGGRAARRQPAPWRARPAASRERRTRGVLRRAPRSTTTSPSSSPG